MASMARCKCVVDKQTLKTQNQQRTRREAAYQLGNLRRMNAPASVTKCCGVDGLLDVGPMAVWLGLSPYYDSARKVS